MGRRKGVAWDEPPHHHLENALTLLNGVHGQLSGCFSARIGLRSYPMTHETMQALSALPRWGCKLDLCDCEHWPLEPSEYKALAKRVPMSYTEWHMKQGVGQHVIDAVCAGINEVRAGSGSGEVVSVELLGERDGKGCGHWVGEHVRTEYRRG